MDKQQAEKFIRAIANEIGLGFHPDTQMEDYIDGNGNALFSPAVASEKQSKLMQCFDLLGEDRIYQVLEPISRKQLKALVS